jgi:Domain of unknown function (DUF4430)
VHATTSLSSVSMPDRGHRGQHTRRRTGSTLLGCLALVAAGCGSSVAAPTVKTGAPMDITLNHGKTVLVKTTLAYGSNAMTDLKRIARVQTSSAGKFVSAINGHAQDTSSSTYWLLYVNCRPASVGATQITIKKGETIWWDLRKTGATLPSKPDPACPFKP